MSPTAELPLLPDGFAWRPTASTVWIEARAGPACAAFTTRIGGVSQPPFESLNLGVLTGDDRELVLENRRRAAAAVGVDPTGIAIGRQVHGDDLMTHDRAPEPARFAGADGDPPEVDGHLIETAGIAGLVFVADCLPIVVGGRRGVAVVHGGWRGLAAGIVEKAAERIGAIEVAIGPAIGPCCYEVGDEVAAHFADLGTEVLDGRMLNLAQAATVLARRAGVERVTSCGLCTRCNPDLFFSHRGEGGRTGRQAGLGWIAEDRERNG